MRSLFATYHHQYLIPVKLLLGQLPRASLLSRYGLAHYADIASAVRRGDVRALNGALEAHQEHFIRAGTYLLLEKLKAGVYRTLFKKIHNIQKLREPTKAFQVPIGLFQARRAARAGVPWGGRDAPGRAGGRAGARYARGGVHVGACVRECVWMRCGCVRVCGLMRARVCFSVRCRLRWGGAAWRWTSTNARRAHTLHCVQSAAARRIFTSLSSAF